jgi:protease IV
MNSRSIFIGLAVAFSVCFIFIITILLVKGMMGNRGTFAIGNRVGVLEVQGIIADSKEFIRQCTEFSDDDSIKAVILRVDSPGGVVGPSQEIHDEVKKLARKKKVIVSMGSVAASGGYYIAAPATLIYANPGTVTGSIGVLMKLTNIQGLLGKVGMNSFVLKSGKFKDTGSPVRPMTEEEKALFQGVLDSMHGQFIRAVAEGRKLSIESVKQIADGRIFSGEQALQFKLVDKLGNFQDAVDAAAAMGGIKGKPNLIYPTEKKKSLFSFLIEETSDNIINKLKLESGFSARYEIPINGPD